MKDKYILHEFSMGDVEDPDIYCAEPIYQWQQTDIGKWCMDKAEDICYHISADPMHFGYRVTLTGFLHDKHATFHALKKT